MTSRAAPIRTRGLTKMYGDLVAVDHLDLEVQGGEIFGLLGQNGAGKTTTILMLLGLTEPTEGQARVVGLDPARRPLEVKRRVGYLPDSGRLLRRPDGPREPALHGAGSTGSRGTRPRPTIDEALEQVGLTARADDRTETYSRGMLQRLGIADALIKDPDVLILDEPTTAIDPLGVTEILDLLRSLVRERQMAILLSSHLLNQVQHVCDRIGIFAAGRLIGQGTMDELAARFGDDTRPCRGRLRDGPGRRHRPHPRAARRHPRRRQGQGPERAARAVGPRRPPVDRGDERPARRSSRRRPRTGSTSPPSGRWPRRSRRSTDGRSSGPATATRGTSDDEREHAAAGRDAARCDAARRPPSP